MLRLRSALRLVLALCLLAVVPATPVAADDGGVQVLVPLPGEILDPGPAWVAFTLGEAGVPGLEVDSVPLDVIIGDGVAAAQVPDLAPGEHAATALMDGSVVRQWSFTVAAEAVVTHDLDDPVAGAIALATARRPDGGHPAAVVVGADAIPDALAAIPLAHALDAALLVTGPAGLAAEITAALPDLLAPGAVVHVLGGPAAVAEQVLRDLDTIGWDAVRHAGAERVGTAVAASMAMPDQQATLAHLVAADAPVDAVAASPGAARAGAPILLTAAASLSEQTAMELQRRGIVEVVAVGGPAVLSESVLDDVRALGIEATRVSGPDRVSTAVAASAAGPETGVGVGLADAGAPLEALLAAADSASQGRTLLLTDREGLPAATRAALTELPPGPVVGFGISTALGRTARSVLGRKDRAVASVVPAAGARVEGLAGLGLLEVRAAAALSSAPAEVTVRLDGLVDLVGLVDVDPADATRARIRVTPPPELSLASQVDVRVVGQLPTSGEGPSIALDWTFTLHPERVYATVRGMALRLPSADVELVGYHESNNPGAIDQTDAAGPVPTLVMPSRGRGTGPTSAADIAANPEVAVTSPVDGVVLRASAYELYCRHRDEFLAIRPDALPDLEVVLLHVEGLTVQPGDRVVAGQTVVAANPHLLPFDSQLDEYTSEPSWPHVHIQVVDPALDTRPPTSC